MHVVREKRDTEILGLSIRSELKGLFTHPKTKGPIENYFQYPESFYLQGWPGNPGDWPTFSEQQLLPLWQHSDQIFALDLLSDKLEVLVFHIECPEEFAVYNSIDRGVFNMIDLHVWEYGGGEKEAGEAIEFARKISMPRFSELELLFSNFSTASSEKVQSIIDKL